MTICKRIFHSHRYDINLKEMNSLHSHRQSFFSGINWIGLDSEACVVEGLRGSRSYVSHINQMADLGFNVIRLTFAGGCVREGVIPELKAINFTANPDLVVSAANEIHGKFDPHHNFLLLIASETFLFKLRR